MDEDISRLLQKVMTHFEGELLRLEELTTETSRSVQSINIGALRTLLDQATALERQCKEIDATCISQQVGGTAW